MKLEIDLNYVWHFDIQKDFVDKMSDGEKLEFFRNKIEFLQTFYADYDWKKQSDEQAYSEEFMISWITENYALICKAIYPAKRHKDSRFNRYTFQFKDKSSKSVVIYYGLPNPSDHPDYVAGYSHWGAWPLCPEEYIHQLALKKIDRGLNEIVSIDIASPQKFT